MRAGRDPREVRLVAVTKTVGTGLIREAVDAGLRVFGESRVQEAAAKVEELAGMGLEWHMIGRLQKNKAKAAVGLFDLIHSVDSAELMGAINGHAEKGGKLQRVMLQVNVSGEGSKFGVEEAGLEGLVRAAGDMANVKVEGLMSIPPFFDDPERARPYFRRLRELNDIYGFPELSMGMTGDFEVAIEEGATMVRVGTAIFGEREYR